MNSTLPLSASRKHQARGSMRRERLVELIQAHREASLARPALQETHEPILEPPRGGCCGRDHRGSTRVRLLRAQALHFADTPGTARLYRQTATDLERR